MNLNDPSLWRQQWLDRGGDSFMSYEQYARPRREALTRRKPRRHAAQLHHAPPKQPDYVLQRLAICLTCPHADPSLRSGCDLLGVNCSPCYRRRATTVCPDVPPRWGPVAN